MATDGDQSLCDDLSPPEDLRSSVSDKKAVLFFLFDFNYLYFLCVLFLYLHSSISVAKPSELDAL